jgi:hypothetical protein
VVRAVLVERNSGKKKIGKEREKDTIREGKSKYDKKEIVNNKLGTQPNNIPRIIMAIESQFHPYMGKRSRKRHVF